MGGGRRRWVEAWGVEDEGGLRPGGVVGAGGWRPGGKWKVRVGESLKGMEGEGNGD